MKFIPEDIEAPSGVPMLHELRADDGWQGQGSSDSIASLRSKISVEIGRLDGTVTKFLQGDYVDGKYKRPGVEIEYQIVSAEAIVFTGRLAIAGPPFEDPYGGKIHHANYKKSLAKNREDSLRVALFNVWKGLVAGRIMQWLSPGYSALLPWLLPPGRDDLTISQIWEMGSRALPAPDDSVDGEFTEVE